MTPIFFWGDQVYRPETPQEVVPIPEVNSAPLNTLGVLPA